MEQITVGFSKPKAWKPYSWLIMSLYSIPYSHVFIKFYSEKFSRDIIYQASHTMVNFMSPVVFSESNDVVAEYEIDIEDNKRTGMIQFAIDNSGKSYGIKQAFGMGLVRIGEILGIRFKNPFADGNQTFVCSELVATVIEDYTKGDLNSNPDEVTPKELYDYCLKIKEIK